MKVDIEKIIELVLKNAKKRKENAGYNGSMDDGGASILKTQVEFYKAGMNGTIPSQWNQYAEEIRKVSDPEFAEYMRLKNKFEK